MSTINFEDRVTIPSEVDDLDAFRRWSLSEDMPESGRFSFIHDTIWMDMSLEDGITHNLVKAEFSSVLTPLAKASRSGHFYIDRMRYVAPAAGLSTEPDGFFISFESVRNGTVELFRDDGSLLEIVGAADMTLEVVSKTSVRKDTVVLRDLYHRAGVREYWLVDARRSPARFDILRHTPEGYVAVEPADGWLTSEVFGHAFRLEESTDPLGNPSYTLAVR